MGIKGKMGLMGRTARGAASVALLLSFAATAKAHEHHMDSIEEGHFVSDDPIVSDGQALFQAVKRTLTDAPGLHTMDPYSGTSVGLGNTIPHRNGPWSESQDQLIG